MNVLTGESTLVDAAAKGDRKAFVELIKQHDDALRALAFSMTGTQADMDDVLQGAYLKAFRSIPRFDKKSSFKTWIYRIVHNTAIDHQREVSRITAVQEDVLHSIPEREADHALGMDIDSALLQLTDMQRAIVLLVDGEGFDYASAAEVLGVPTGTIASRLSQARSRLRSLLATSYKETNQ